MAYSQDWQQVGLDINGAAPNLQFGRSADLSGDGTTFAVGSNEYNNGSGQTLVYKWNGSNWIQKGQPINGQSTNELSSSSVSINENGNTLAIGAPQSSGGGANSGTVRIFEWNGNNWIQKGSNIDGTIDDYSGYSIVISGDANSVAISSAGIFNAGKVEVYTWNGSNWVQKGSDFLGQNTDDCTGVAVSLSYDGNTLSYGSPNNDDLFQDAGKVSVFTWNGISWVNKGLEINGTILNQGLGSNISLTNDGNTIGIGCPANNSATGLVKIYVWNGSNWMQKGADILGAASGDFFGTSVSLSENGNVIAIGSSGTDGIGSWDGSTHVYTFNGLSWITYGSSIFGNSQDCYSGSIVVLNDSGNTLLLSEPSNSSINPQSGRVKAFRFCFPISTVDIKVSCDSYTWIDGNTYSTNNNTATFVLQNPKGCDSLVFLDLTILNSSNTIFSDTICGGPYIWNNISYSNSGNYIQTFPSQNGCDSVVTLHLIVYPNNFNPTFSSSQQLFTNPPFAVQFSNTTTNPSNYNFTWYWGDGTSTTSNNVTVFHEYLTNGLYTVTLEATSMQTGCFDETTLTDYIYTTGGVSCAHAAALVQSGPINACSGQNVVLNCNSSPTFSYQWRRNGIYIQGNNNDTLIVTQPGNYSVIISENGCPVSSSQVTVNFSTIASPVISSNGSIQPCVGGSVTLSATSGYSSYLWSNGATTQSTSFTSSGIYTVQVTNSSGCSASSNPFTINASILPSQNICVVGVDSITNNIRVVWEKPITSAIDSFYVYRETSVSNVYAQVGARPYDSLSVWLDPIANPAVQAYRYKITALDTCGSETPLSNFHKTIHLTINQGVGNTWNLIWSNYEGISFGSYNIYRGTSPSNLSLLTTIQSNLNSYTDLSAPAGNVYYQIEILNPNNCVPTKSMNYSSSKSNIVNTNSSSIDEISESNITVYPNPANELLIIESGILLNSKFRIIDAIGRTVYNGFLSSNKNVLDITSFSKGTYTLIVENIGKPVRFVKQ